MPKCSVCSRPDVGAVDDKLVAGVTLDRIAKAHPPVTTMSLSRHRRGCLTPALVALQAQEVVNGGIGNAQRLANLYQRAEAVLTRAEADKHGALSLAAIRELRGICELLARMTGELDERPTVQVLNLAMNPEYLDVRGRIIAALAPYPEARLAVAHALADKPREITA